MEKFKWSEETSLYGVSIPVNMHFVSAGSALDGILDNRHKQLPFGPCLKSLDSMPLPMHPRRFKK